MNESESSRREMPKSIEAEQSVLAAILLDNRAFDQVGNILADRDFFDARHSLIWSAVSALCVSSKPADIFTVHDRLTSTGVAERAGGLEYLQELSGASYSTRNIQRHAEIVRERSMHRSLIAAAQSACDMAWTEGDVGEKVDQITTLFGELHRKQVKKMPRHISEIAIGRIDEYGDLADGKRQPGWRTHIPALTAKLNGGLKPGGFYILAARPSVGKSSLAGDLGIHFALDDLPALFLSQEMTSSEVIDRSFANIGRVGLGALLNGRMQEEDWTRTAEAMERMGSLPFYVDDQPSLTLQDIRFKAKAVKGLKVLIVDYLQLCASSRRDGNRNSEIEEISRGLKTLAKELDIAVLALSQLNREVEKRANKRPTLADLRDSGAIEQDADVVMFLWPVRAFESEGRQILGLGLDKNRQGLKGDIALDFFGDVQRWQESTADIRPDNTPRKGGFE